MMTYYVTLNYTKFKFDNGQTALTFAEIAKNYATEDINVELEIEGSFQPTEDDIEKALEEVED